MTWILTLFLSFGAFAKTDELTIALNAEFETINPIINTMMASIYIQDATLRQLVVLGPDGKARPVLLKSIPSIENKKATLIKREKGKGLKVDLEFLPEAVWGDGAPITCNDIKLSWDIGRSQNVSTPNKETYDNLEDLQIDSKDPKKCTLIYKEAKYNFYLNFPRIVPSHLEGPIFQTHKDKPQAYERNSLYVREPANPGLYNGPYRISELKLGSHVLMVPNEKFFGKKPQFKKVVFKFILNTATMESNLRSGAVNMLSSSGLSLDQAFTFEKKIKAEKLPFEIHFVPGMIYSHIDLNMENPILSDVRVRKALAYSLNREEMLKAFFHGRMKTAEHFAAPIDSWFTTNPAEMTIYKYDRVKAGKLLDEAGWKMGADGFRYKDGKKLSLKLSGPVDNKLNETMQVYMQDTWKKIGLELVIKNYPARVLFPEIFRKRNFDMGMYAFVMEPNDTQKPILHSSMIPSDANSWSGKNRPGWKNKEVDMLLDQFEEEFDRKKQIQLMKKVIKAYTDELPHLPLYFKANTSVVPKGLKNFRLSGHSHSEYLEIENWTF